MGGAGCNRHRDAILYTAGFRFLFHHGPKTFGVVYKAVIIIEEENISRLLRSNRFTSARIFLYFSCRCMVGLAFNFRRIESFISWSILLLIHGSGFRSPSFFLGMCSETMDRKVSFQRFQSILISSDDSYMVEHKFFSRKAAYRPSMSPLT